MPRMCNRARTDLVTRSVAMSGSIGACSWRLWTVMTDKSDGPGKGPGQGAQQGSSKPTGDDRRQPQADRHHRPQGERGRRAEIRTGADASRRPSAAMCRGCSRRARRLTAPSAAGSSRGQSTAGWRSGRPAAAAKAADRKGQATRLPPRAGSSADRQRHRPRERRGGIGTHSRLIWRPVSPVGCSP